MRNDDFHEDSINKMKELKDKYFKIKIEIINNSEYFFEKEIVLDDYKEKDLFLPIPSSQFLVSNSLHSFNGYNTTASSLAIKCPQLDDAS